MLVSPYVVSMLESNQFVFIKTTHKILFDD